MKYSVKINFNKTDKKNDVLLLLQNKFLNQQGIIYCLSIKESEEYTEFLKANNISALSYHSSLLNEKKLKIIIYVLQEK